jgi:hypothetical protein
MLVAATRAWAKIFDATCRQPLRPHGKEHRADVRVATAEVDSPTFGGRLNSSQPRAPCEIS